MREGLARRMGVHAEAIKNWGRGVPEPTVRPLPRLMEFPAYDPQPEPAELPV